MHSPLHLKSEMTFIIEDIVISFTIDEWHIKLR